MHLFELHRDIDETGISGTGVVAEGVVFTDGSCTLRWLPGAAGAVSTVIYGDIADVEAIHGHGGKTRIVTLD